MSNEVMTCIGVDGNVYVLPAKDAANYCAGPKERAKLLQIGHTLRKTASRKPVEAGLNPSEVIECLALGAAAGQKFVNGGAEVEGQEDDDPGNALLNSLCTTMKDNAQVGGAVGAGWQMAYNASGCADHNDWAPSNTSE